MTFPLGPKIPVAEVHINEYRPTRPTHVMKSWPWFFQAFIDGLKLHDLRQSDRDFKVGDYVLLQEFDPRTGEYSGRELIMQITYITSNMTPCALSSNALAKDHVILSLRKVSDE